MVVYRVAAVNVSDVTIPSFIPSNHLDTHP